MRKWIIKEIDPMFPPLNDIYSKYIITEDELKQRWYDAVEDWNTYGHEGRCFDILTAPAPQPEKEDPDLDNFLLEACDDRRYNQWCDEMPRRDRDHWTQLGWENNLVNWFKRMPRR